MVNQVPAFNWWMSPAETPRAIEQLLSLTAAHAVLMFRGELDGEGDVILEVKSTGFTLVFSPSLAENTIHPSTMEGAGSITAELGHLPILFFAYLRQQITKAMPELIDNLTFCDENGESIKLDSWRELKCELERLDLDPTLVRADAEAIGFVDAIIRLDQLCTDVPSMFF